MNCQIRIPGGTVIVGDAEVNFAEVAGPIVVLTSNEFSGDNAYRLFDAPHLTHLYLGALTSVEFVELLSVKQYIKVPQITIIYNEQIRWFARALLSTRCMFATTVCISDSDLLVRLLEGQAVVRGYRLGMGSKFPMLLITNDPEVNEGTWDQFALINTPETLVLRCPLGDEDILTQPYAGVVRNQVILPSACEWGSEFYVIPCRELVCNWVFGDIPTWSLQAHFVSLTLHVSSERDLGAFRVEDLHPFTGRVEIVGCRAEMTLMLNQREAMRRAEAILSSLVPRLGAKSSVRRMGPSLLRCVAEMQ